MPWRLSFPAAASGGRGALAGRPARRSKRVGGGGNGILFRCRPPLAHEVRRKGGPAPPIAAADPGSWPVSAENASTRCPQSVLSRELTDCHSGLSHTEHDAGGARLPSTCTTGGAARRYAITTRAHARGVFWLTYGGKGQRSWDERAPGRNLRPDGPPGHGLAVYRAAG